MQHIKQADEGCDFDFLGVQLPSLTRDSLMHANGRPPRESFHEQQHTLERSHGCWYVCSGS